MEPRSLETMPTNDLAQRAEQFFLEKLLAVTEIIQRLRLDGLQVTEKADRSLLTQVDEAVDRYLLGELRAEFPDFQIITEETSAAELADTSDRQIYADPIDETSEFVRGGKDFGTLIGLVEHGVPVAGAMLFPDHGKLVYAMQGHGAWVLDLAQPHQPAQRLRRSVDLPVHFTAVHERDDILLPFLKPDLQQHLAIVPRTNLRGLTDVILGKEFGHIYAFRGGPWDIAGPQAIAQELGLQVTHVDGTPVDYRTKNLKKIHQQPIIFTQPDVRL